MSVRQSWIKMLLPTKYTTIFMPLPTVLCMHCERKLWEVKKKGWQCWERKNPYMVSPLSISQTLSRLVFIFGCGLQKKTGLADFAGLLSIYKCILRALPGKPHFLMNKCSECKKKKKKNGWWIRAQAWDTMIFSCVNLIKMYFEYGVRQTNHLL